MMNIIIFVIIAHFPNLLWIIPVMFALFVKLMKRSQIIN